MSKELTFNEKLVEIQGALVVPKNQRNDFAKFNYRSCEQILETVKPLLTARGLGIILEDEMVQLGDRYYIKATAKIFQDHTDGERTVGMEASAYAREPEEKKGMDSAQLSGSVSSYARKYALNGLFAIDDCQDADTNEYRAYQGRTSGKETPADTNPREDAVKTAANQAVEKHGDEYKKGAVYDMVKMALNEHCQAHNIKPGELRDWIKGQYQGRTIATMKNDDGLLLEVLDRVVKECSSTQKQGDQS